MLRPLHDIIVLEKLPSEKKVGSIVLTSEKKVGNVATVVAVPADRKDDKGNPLPFPFKEGMKVIYREYAGTDYEEDGHKYLLLKEEDVLAIVE